MLRDNYESKKYLKSHLIYEWKRKKT